MHLFHIYSVQTSDVERRLEEQITFIVVKIVKSWKTEYYFPDCTFRGLLYRDGEDFQNPSKPCERCLCMAGNVACDSRLCPQVP